VGVYRHMFAVLVMSLIMPLAAHADKATDQEYTALLETGGALAEQNNFGDAIRKFRAAATIKTSPAAWLFIVDLYGRLSAQSQAKPNYCPEAKAMLGRFFDACESCKQLSSPSEADKKACRPCSNFKVWKFKGQSLGLRTARLAEEIRERGDAKTEGAESRRLGANLPRGGTDRGKGLVSLSKQVSRCLGYLSLKTTPPGATALIDNKQGGITPTKIPLFHGKNRLTLKLNNHGDSQEEIAIQRGKTTQKEVTLKALELTAPVTRITTGQGGDSNLAGWISVGAGGLAVVTAGVFFAKALAKRDEADALNGEYGRRGEFNDLKDESRTALTVAGISAGVGLITAGAGVWLLMEKSGTTDKTSIEVSPGAVSLRGTF